MGYRGTKFTRQKIAALRQLDAGFSQVELTSCCGLLTSQAPLLSICRLKVCSVEAGGATEGEHRTLRGLELRPWGGPTIRAR